MDIKREAPKKTKRNVLIAVGVVALTATTLALSNLEARPPSVSRSELWVDSVQRGTMVRQVRAPGTLVPENIRYVAAVTAGRVEARPLRPGSRVTATTILLELSNPEVQLQALEAQRQLTQAEQDLVTLRTTLETNRLNQASQVAQVRTLRANALRDATVIEGLDAKGLSSKNEVERARDQVKELDTRLELEVQRLDIMTAAMQEQLAKARANLEQVRQVARFQAERVASMRVMSGLDGELQTLPLELGQWVVPGQTLATVAQPGRLKAVLRVPETQAKAMNSDTQPITVSIDEEGKIYLQETEIPIEEVVPKLEAISKTGYDERIYVRGDKTADYGTVMKVMARISAAGYKNLGLVTLQEQDQ